MRFLAPAIVVPLWLFAFALPAVRGWDVFEEFQQARRGLQQQLRSKQPSTRVSGVRGLQAFPVAESVKLVNGCLLDEDPTVREAGYTSLVKMSGNQEVCDTLLALAAKSVARQDGGLSAAPLLAALLSSNLPSVRRDSVEFLDATAARGTAGELVLVTLADELGAHKAAIDVLPLVRLATTKTYANHFGLRRAVVAALTRIHTSESIGALVDLLKELSGEVKVDAVEHLTKVTGQIFGLDAAAWGRWWIDSQAGWKYPVRSVETPYRSVAINTSSEYGMPLFAERLVFVLDTSGSMTGPRIVAAKRELIATIESLSERVHFGVLVFNGSVTTWHRELVAATSEQKRAAANFINNQSPQSNTASYDALEAAFRFDVEAIYFLSDGAPFGGKIQAPVDIVAAIAAINKTRRVSIYTIGIGAGIPGGPLDAFLKTLAEQNMGLYRRVDG